MSGTVGDQSAVCIREALFLGGLWPGSLRFVLAPFLGFMAAAPYRISLMRRSDK